MNVKRLKKSFTLIELLVVIAIIAILASMLLPALNKAKTTAKRIQCVANLKTFGQYVTIYINENKDYIVPMYWTNGKTGGYWYNTLPLYIEGKDMYSANLFKKSRCPNGRERTNTGATNTYWCYGFYGMYGLTGSYPHYRRIQDLKKKSLSSMAYIIDFPEPNFRTDNINISSAVDSYLPGTGNAYPQISTSTGRMNDSYFYRNDYLSGRHGDAISMLFLDTHVSVMASKDAGNYYYFNKDVKVSPFVWE